MTVDLGPTTPQNTGGAGIDTVSGFEGIIGSAFADVLLRGFAASVRLTGGAGDDVFHDHNFGSDTFDGGEGVDRIDYVTGGSDAVSVDLAMGRATSIGVSVNTLIGIEDAGGSDGNDVLLGNDAANRLDGRGGDDILSGAGAAPGQYNRLNGDEGSDTVSYVGTSLSVEADLHSGQAYLAGVLTDLMTSVENLLGGAGHDTLAGSDSVNVIGGGDGNDLLYGFGGDDILTGGLASPGGYNALYGGNGSDTASYQGTMGAVYANLETGGALVAGVFTDAFNSIENLKGGSSDDTLVGDGGGNRVEGGGGTDLLFGMAGNDVLVGGTGTIGQNQLFGGIGSTQ